VIKRHLNEDGIFQNWYPAIAGDDTTAASITKTLIQSFPYVRAFRSFDTVYGTHFLASMKPIPLSSAAELAARMPRTAASDLVEWGHSTTAEGQFSLVLSQEIPLRRLLIKASNVPALSDDRPVNEYFLLRRWFNAPI